MDIRKLQRLVVDALEDVKGQDIVVYNTVELTSLFDRVVIVSGTSNRQTRALASNVRDKVKAAGGEVLSIEGEDTGEWVLVDFGDLVVHVMQPAIRAYYNLEEIWGARPVRMQIARAPATSRAAAGREPTAVRRPTVAKAAVAKTLATKAPAARRKPRAAAR